MLTQVRGIQYVCYVHTRQGLIDIVLIVYLSFLQSGATKPFWATQSSVDTAEVARIVAARTTCQSSSIEFVDCMRNLDAGKLTDAAEGLDNSIMPVVDGVVVRAPGEDIIASGNFSKVDVFTGQLLGETY